MKDVAILLLIISIFSILNFSLGKFNLIFILLSLELFLLGVSLLFISGSLIFDDMYGIMTALFILTIGAAESAIGLSLLTKQTS